MKNLKKTYLLDRVPLSRFLFVLFALMLMATNLSIVQEIQAEEIIHSKYFSTEEITLPNGTILEKSKINGPPKPPKGFIRPIVSLPNLEVPLELSNVPPGMATLVTPFGTISDDTPAYTWNAVSGSAEYYLWVKDRSGNIIKNWYTATDAGCAGGTGQCSVTPSTSLTTGSVKWWIRTRNTNGNNGPWSTRLKFNLVSP